MTDINTTPSVNTTTATDVTDAASGTSAATATTPKPLVFDQVHILTYIAITLSALFMTGVIPTDGFASKLAATAGIILTYLGYAVHNAVTRSSANQLAGMMHASTLRHQERLTIKQPIAIRPREAGRVSLGVLVGIVLVMWALFSGTSCTQTQRDSAVAKGKTMSGDFASCAKADLGQIVATSGITLLGDVAALVKGDASAVEDELSRLAGVVGADGVTCAISAVKNVLEPIPSTAPATGQRLPGLVRALAWRDQVGAKAVTP